MMDHMKPQRSASGLQEPDMLHLTMPRGRGYSLRLVTPGILVGTQNPWTGKPFGKEVKLGLNTRSHAEAVRLRDVRVGQVRQLEAEALANAGRKSVGKIIDLSPESAAEWRQMGLDAGDPGELDHVLIDELEKADVLNFLTESFAWDQAVPAGQLQIGMTGETVECALVLMENMHAQLPALVAGRP